MTYEELEELFENAKKAFPYRLDFTSVAQGELDVAPDEDIEYGEEHTFEVGHLLDEKLMAGGWIELRRDDGDITITGFFGVARNGDWENGQILPEYTAIQGAYNIKTAEWELWIDQY